MWNYETSGKHERAAPWLSHFFPKTSDVSGSQTRLTSKNMKRTRLASTRNAATFSTYKWAVHCLLWTHATDEKTANIKNEIATFIRPPYKPQMPYTGGPVTMTLCRKGVYGQQDLNEIRNKAIDEYIKKSISEYCSTQETASFHDSEFHAISLMRLQVGQQGMYYSNTSKSKYQIWRPARLIQEKR